MHGGASRHTPRRALLDTGPHRRAQDYHRPALRVDLVDQAGQRRLDLQGPQSNDIRFGRSSGCC
jgi:hypothetical protein